MQTVKVILERHYTVGDKQEDLFRKLYVIDFGRDPSKEELDQFVYEWFNEMAEQKGDDIGKEWKEILLNEFAP